MQTKHLCVLIHIWTKGEVCAPLNLFKPSGKIFYCSFQGGTSFVDLLCFFGLVFAMPLCASVYMCLVVTCGKGLTSWLSLVVSDCDFVTFPLVSWVRCGTWLYRFLSFAPLLTFSGCRENKNLAKISEYLVAYQAGRFSRDVVQLCE